MLIKKNDFKRLVSNFSFLFLLNIANFVFPLITFPYLISVLGLENFGLINFATSIVAYFVLITDYGFNLTATRDISINRNNNVKINEIFSSVILIKLLLSLICFVVFVIIVLSVPKLYADKWVYLFTFLSVFSQVFFPIWLFQGMEKMKIVSVLFFVAKLIFTIILFLFVKNDTDYLYVPILNFFSYFIISIISFFFAVSYFKISIKVPSFLILKTYLFDGWYLFISNISVTLYSTATITILGFFTNNTVVGYYTVADKVIQAIRSIMNPISQVLFPYLANLSISFPRKVLEINNRFLKMGVMMFIPFTFLLFYFSENILLLLTNSNNERAIIVFKVLSFLPFVAFFHIIYAMFTILVFKKNKIYGEITLQAGIINVILSSFLIYFFQEIGAAASILLIEIYTGIRYYLYTKKVNFLIS